MFSISEVGCNRGIMSTPLGDAIFRCPAGLKKKNGGSRTPPDATLSHDFSRSERDAFADKEDHVHEQDWLSNHVQVTITNSPPTPSGKSTT